MKTTGARRLLSAALLGGAVLVSLALGADSVGTCVPVPVDACPAAAPIGAAGCSDGLSCEYGEECCCGDCHPSLVCDCRGGQWGCYYTDACMIPHCPGECRSERECEGGQMCRAPDAPPLCGMCRMPELECGGDADCAAGTVCDWETGGCLCNPAMLCIPACHSAAGCDAGESCTADGHCVPTPCTNDADCPAHFHCPRMGRMGAPTCARRDCTNDAGCEGGYCVQGRCYGELGTCLYPPP